MPSFVRISLGGITADPLNDGGAGGCGGGGGGIDGASEDDVIRGNGGG